MIHWLQTLLEKHRKWLLGVLLLVIIIPFVFTIGSMPGFGYRKKQNQDKRLFGCNLSDQKDLERVMREGAFSVALTTGSEENAWLESAQGYAFYRLLLLQDANALRFPEPSEEALHSFLKTRKLFWNEAGTFEPKLYNDYLAKWEERFGRSDGLRRLLVNDFKCNQVREVLREPGFLLPEESEFLYKRWKTIFNLSCVHLKASTETKVAVPNEEVQAFYEKNKKNYRVGQRAEVALLFFDEGKHRSKLPLPSNGELRTYFEGHRSEFIPNDEEKQANDFEDVKEKVKAQWENNQLNQLTEKAATQFAISVYDQGIRMGSEAWKRMLDAEDVRVIESIPPFEKKSIPERKGLPKEVLAQAFSLDTDRFISDPMRVKNGYIVVVLKQFLEPFIPKLEDVSATVVADCKAAKSRRLFLEKAKEIRDALVSEKDDIAPVLTKFDLTVKVLEPFALENGFSVLSGELGFPGLLAFSKELEEMRIEDWSQPVETKEGVCLLKLLKKQAPSFNPQDPAFLSFKKELIERKKQLQSESIWREILERTMAQLQENTIK